MATFLLLLNCFTITFYISSIILNTLGVYLLCATRPLSNSKILLLNLAASDLVTTIIGIANNFRHVLGLEALIELEKILASFSIVYYFSIYFLTVDRLIATLFPLKYIIILTKRHLVRAIVTKWLTISLFGISFFLRESWFTFIWQYIWVILDLIFIVLCLVTYGLILTKLLARRRLQHENRDREARRRQRRIINRNQKFFKIVALIVVSFIFLNLVPDVILFFQDSDDQVVLGILGMIWSLGVVMDPLIYVFLQDDLRLVLKRRILAVWGLFSNEQDTAL